MHICQFLGVGGLEKVLYLLIQEQLKANYEVELVIYDYEKTWVSKFEQLGIKVHSEYTKSEGYDRKLLNYLDEKVRDFTHIHTHDLNPMLYIGVLKIITKLKLKKFPKIIHTTHGMEHVVAQPKTKLYECFLAWTADKVITVSEAFKEYYLKKTFVSKNKVINIDNGTPVPEKLPDLIDLNLKNKIIRAHDIEAAKSIWIAVARVVPLKDQKILSDAMSHFPNKHLILIGPSGNNKYYQEIEQSKGSNVTLAGKKENISEYLAASELFLSASHHEGIPISVLEAAASGTPCVLSNIDGHNTLNSNNFYTFNIRDSKSLINTLKTINNTDSEKKRLAFYRAVLDNYSANKMFNLYHREYQKIL